MRSSFKSTCMGGATLFALSCTLPLAAQDARTSAFDPSAPAADPALTGQAQDLVDTIWSELVLRCGNADIFRVDERLVIELDTPRYELVAMRLPEAASESGYAWRGIAMASATRWRWRRLDKDALDWSAWHLGESKIVRDDNLTLDRGFTEVEDVVLKFDIFKKDGAWSATAPISQVSYAVKPLDLEKLAPAEGADACQL